MTKGEDGHMMHNLGTDTDLEAEDTVALLGVSWKSHAPSMHRRRVPVVVALLVVGSAMCGTYLCMDHVVQHRGKAISPHRLSFTNEQEIVSLDGSNAKNASHQEKKNNIHANVSRIEGTAKESKTFNQNGTNAKVKPITKEKHSNMGFFDANATAVLVAEDYEVSKQNKVQISLKKGEWVFENKRKSNWTFVYTDKKQGWVPNWVLSTATDRNNTASPTIEKFK